MVSKGSEYESCNCLCTYLSSIYYKFMSKKALIKTKLRYAQTS